MQLKWFGVRIASTLRRPNDIRLGEHGVGEQQSGCVMMITVHGGKGAKMSKYDCTKTLDFVHEFMRLHDVQDSCEVCPLYGYGCSLGIISEKHIKSLQKWSGMETHVRKQDDIKRVRRELLELSKMLNPWR